MNNSNLRKEVLGKLNREISRLRSEFKGGNICAWDCMELLKKQREIVYRIPTVKALHEYALENFLIPR